MAVERKSVSINFLVTILEISPQLRRPEDIEQVLRYSLTFKFFRDIFERQSSTELLVELSKYLALKYFKPGEFVFQSDDPSDYFYFIVKGGVKILSNTYIDQEEPGDEDLHRTIRKALEGALPRGKKSKDMIPEIEIATLFAGDSFGEMAIINERSRYFTAKAADNTILAALHRNDYYKIEGMQEKAINKKIDFLRTLEAFKSWSRIPLFKLSFYFKEYVYRRGAIVYHEGDLPNAIYIIKKGDFKFTQLFSIDAGNKSLAANKDIRENSALKSVRANTIRYKDLQVVTRQSGEIFGYEEIFEKLPTRKFTCKCLSQKGKVFIISEKNFTKRITHPETIKIIEEQCKTFKMWAVPRIEKLKELEIFKDDASFTPYQKLKVTPRAFITNPVGVTRNYAEYVQENVIPLPVILKKIMTTRNHSLQQSPRHKKYPSRDSSMFPTEVRKDFENSQYLNMNATAGNARASYFFPSKITKSKVKKLKTNLF